MNRKIAPVTPPARNAVEALANIEALLKVRNAGWDRTAVRDVIAVCYGSTENFVKHHRTVLAWMAKHDKTFSDRLDFDWKAA